MIFAEFGTFSFFWLSMLSFSLCLSLKKLAYCISQKCWTNRFFFLLNKVFFFYYWFFLENCETVPPHESALLVGRV